MRRLLALWGVMMVAMLVATVLGSYGLFRHVDVTFEAFSLLVVIPPFQALVLAWATSAPYEGTLRDAWTHLTAHALARPVLIIDAALLPLGWILRDRPFVGLSGASSLQLPWLAAKAVLAGVCLLVAGWRAADHGQASRQDSGRDLLAFGMCLLIAGLHPWVPWLPYVESGLAGLSALRQPAVLARLELYGTLWLAFLVLALKAGSAIVRHVPRLDRAWDAGLALCQVGMLSVALNSFLYSELIDPYRGVWLTSTSLSATVLLLCTLAVFEHA